jgi:hypothetical protein
VKLKTLAVLTAAAFAAVGFESASACSFSAWGQGLSAGAGTVSTAGVATTSGSTATGNPTTASLVGGEPDDASIVNGVAVARYSGRCASLAKASGNYTQDGLPAGEKTYRARFYVYTGLTAGSALVFQALDGNATGNQKIGVTYNRDQNRFDIQANAGAATQVTGVDPNRWYSVEFNWNANTPSMTATVFGEGSATALATDVAVAGVAAADVIESARIGWISGTGTGTINVDAFESRRSTAIGVLCRADSNNDRVINIFDVGTVTNERVNGVLSTGQPDCNEDGAINVFDVGCTVARRLAGATCS